MEQHCINTGVCLMPESDIHFDVTCISVSNDRSLLATGTKQGVILLWTILDSRYVELKREALPMSVSSFRDYYERQRNIKLKPNYMLIANNNSIAFPVIQAEFALGDHPVFKLKDGETDDSRIFNGIEMAEDTLISLHKDNTIYIWSLTNYRCLHRVKGPPFPIMNIVVLSDRRFIALIGEYKINIIDSWSIKLVETLNANQLKRGSPVSAALDENEDVMSPDILLDTISNLDYTLEEGPKIIYVSTSPHPNCNLSDTTVSLLLVALLDNNEMLLWDLTNSIASYKLDNCSYHGSIKVVTEWDKYIRLDSNTVAYTPPLPLREHKQELDGVSLKSIGVFDNLIFILADFRIFIWHYEDNELIRVAEIISEFKDNKFEQWSGFKCLRSGDLSLLIIWSKKGRVTIYKILPTGGVHQFHKFETLQFPSFGWKEHLKGDDGNRSQLGIDTRRGKMTKAFTSTTFVENDNSNSLNSPFISIFLKDEVPSLLSFIMLIRGAIYFGRSGLTDWQRHDLDLSRLFKNPSNVSNTCIVERDGVLHKIELLSNGILQCVNLNNFKIEYMTSPNLINGVLHKIDKTWRFKQFVILFSKAQENFISNVEPVATCTNSLIFYLIGTKYLVIVLEKGELIIYSLDTLKVELLINKSTYPIKSVYTIRSIVSNGDKLSDFELILVSDSFISLDTSGSLLYINISELLQSCRHSHFPTNLQITDDLIYSDADITKSGSAHSSEKHSTVSGICGIRGEASSRRCHPRTSASSEHFPIEYMLECRDHKGYYHMESTNYLIDIDIVRVVVNNERDLLFVLTYSDILLWKTSTGQFIRRMPQLDVYRQALLSNSKSNMNESLKSSMTFTDTLSLFLGKADDLNNKYLDQIRSKMPNYLLSMALFSEKYYKRNITSTSIYLSFLHLQFKRTDKTCKKSENLRSSCPAGSSSLCPTDTTTDCLGMEAVGAKAFKVSLKSNFWERRWRFGRKHYRSLTISSKTMKSLQIKLKDRSFRSKCKRKSERYTPPVDVTTKVVPLIIYPLLSLLTNNNDNERNIMNILSSPVHCHMGIPHGTISIPLTIKDFGRFIKDRIEYNKLILPQSLNETINFRKKTIKRCNSFPKIKPSHCPAGYHDLDLPNHHLRNEARLSERKHNPQYAQTTRGHFKESDEKDDTNERLCPFFGAYHRYNLNSYFSTCMMLQDLYRLGAFTYEGIISDVDIWLIARLMLICTSRSSFECLCKVLNRALLKCSNDLMDLHVSRALSYLYSSQSFKMKSSVFTQVYICHCHSTTFTFGTRCGSCLRACPLDEINYNTVNPPKNWEEEAALIILTAIALQRYLYSMANHIRIGVKQYTLASYVAQQLVSVIVPQAENSKRVTSQNRFYDARTYFLEMFKCGFGIVWNLSTLEKHSILPDYFRYSKLASLYRSDCDDTEGHMDNAYFVLSVLNQYHVTQVDAWNRILQLCFFENTKLVIDIIGWIIKKRKLGKPYILASMRTIMNFMRNFRQATIKHLPEIVNVIIKFLDPSDHNIRVYMLKNTTSALFYLVKTLPMVDFHQETQRFAIGSQTGHVIIYDLRTATRWRVLMGDQSEIASVAFGGSGNLIAAYYISVPCFIVWKCSTSGLIGSLLNTSTKEYKMIKLKEVSRVTTFNEVSCYYIWNGCISSPLHLSLPHLCKYLQLQNIKIQHKSNDKWFLHREDGKGYMISA